MFKLKIDISKVNWLFLNYYTLCNHLALSEYRVEHANLQLDLIEKCLQVYIYPP